MASSDDIAHQQNLLTIHRRNLAHYLRQQTTLGGPAYIPPGVANGIEEERANIRRLKGILRGWGQSVEDHPDDVAPAPATEQSGVSATSQVGRDVVSVQDSPGAITGQVETASQNFGTQNTTNAGTVVHIHGGDFRGSNLPIGNSVGGDLNQSGGAMSTFDQRGW